MGVCRYCHSQIGDAAQQCFTCGWDWHDNSQPVRRGSVRWQHLGVRPGEKFVIELCESWDGDRFVQLRQATDEPNDPFYMAESEPFDGGQLIEWGIHDYPNHLKLQNGEGFWFDNTGQWQTNSSFVRLGDQEPKEWTGETSHLVSKEIACEAATVFGKSFGLDYNAVFDAVLIDERGKPTWHVMLILEEGDGDSGLPNSRLVRVDAESGEVHPLIDWL